MRPHAGGPARVWTDDTLARVRETLSRHRTIAGAASELGMSASGIQSAFWSRREQLGGQARDFLMRSSAPVSASAIPVVQGSAPTQVESRNHSELPKGSREPLLPPITRPEPLPPMSTGTARVRRSVERILFIPDVHVPFEDH